MSSIDILLIEDNRHDIEMILDALHEHDMNYNVLAFNDGVKALDYFFGALGCLDEGTAELPKLIMLDLKLPKVDGLEVLKQLKSDERTRHIPVVIFSSSNEYRDRIESYSRGANSYMVKPLDAEVFSHSVAHIGSYWVAMNATVYNKT